MNQDGYQIFENLQRNDHGTILESLQNESCCQSNLIGSLENPIFSK